MEVRERMKITKNTILFIFPTVLYWVAYLLVDWMSQDVLVVAMCNGLIYFIFAGILISLSDEVDEDRIGMMRIQPSSVPGVFFFRSPGRM